MMVDNGFDGYCGDFNNYCVIIVEVLKGLGYMIYMLGKWYVIKSVVLDGLKVNWLR